MRMRLDHGPLSCWTPEQRTVFPPDRLAGVEREALLSGLVHPGGREPAPGSLALVQAFVNSVDAEHGPDLFDDAAGLAEWLARHGLGAAVRPHQTAAARGGPGPAVSTPRSAASSPPPSRRCSTAAGGA